MNAAEKGRKKRITTLIIIGAAAVVAVAAFLIVKSVTAPKEAADQTKEIYSLNGTCTITIDYLGEKYSYQETGEGWKCVEEPAFPINKNYMRDMKDALSSVNAVAQLDAGKPEEYGLDDPVCTVTVTTEDGSSKVFEIGSVNDTSNVCYVRTDGNIYAVDDSFAQVFCHSFLEMADRTLIPSLQAFSTKEITLSYGGKTIVIDQNADQEKVKELLKSLSDITLERCEFVHPTQADMEYCGFGDACEFKADDFEIKLAKSSTDGTTYVYFPDEDVIFKASGVSDKWFTQPDEREYLDGRVITIEYKDIKSMTIDGKKMMPGDGSQSDECWKLYYTLSQMKAEGFTEAVNGIPEITVDIEPVSGKPIKIAFIKVDENYYAAEITVDEMPKYGGLCPLINRRYIGELK